MGFVVIGISQERRIFSSHDSIHFSSHTKKVSNTSTTNEPSVPLCNSLSSEYLHACEDSGMVISVFDTSDSHTHTRSISLDEGYSTVKYIDDAVAEENDSDIHMQAALQSVEKVIS